MTNTKKKKGNKMKLLSAVGMLTVSAAMLVSSTFAWFSLNKNVTATSMSVTAKTDSPYLEIKLHSGDVSTYAKTIDGAFESDIKLIPTAPMTTLTSSNVGTITNWGIAHSDDPDDAAIAATKTALTADDNLGDYVIKKSFDIRIRPGSADAQNLRLVGLKTAYANQADALTCLRVVLVCGSNVFTYDADGTTALESNILATTVGSSATQVDAYFYYAGDDTDCKTNNATNVDGITVDLEFAVNGEVHSATALPGATRVISA